jgi:hypothetical protein
MWGGAGALAVPASTLLHELGHYAIYRFFGAPQLELHYSSISFDRAAAGLPGWQVALSEVAGPMVSVVILWLAVWFARRLSANPLVVAMGLVSSLRFYAPFAVGALLILRWALHSRGGALGTNVDEFNAALAAGVPPLLVIAPAVVIVAAGDAMLLRSLPKGRRLMPLIWLAAGTVIGFVGYFRYLGPWVLP